MCQVRQALLKTCPKKAPKDDQKNVPKLPPKSPQNIPKTNRPHLVRVVDPGDDLLHDLHDPDGVLVERLGQLRVGLQLVQGLAAEPGEELLFWEGEGRTFWVKLWALFVLKSVKFW